MEEIISEIIENNPPHKWFDLACEALPDCSTDCILALIEGLQPAKDGVIF